MKSIRQVNVMIDDLLSFSSRHHYFRFSVQHYN